MGRILRPMAGDIMPIAPIVEIIAEIKAGRMVILVDEEDRENEGDLVLAADHVTPVNRSVHGTNFTVSIEAAHGVTTGISAADRAHTIRVAAAAHATPDDIVQPGHVFPLIAQPGGVLARAGHTEACCDLARLAGASSSAVLCEIMKDDGTMARLPDLEIFAR